MQTSIKERLAVRFSFALSSMEFVKFLSLYIAVRGTDSRINIVTHCINMLFTVISTSWFQFESGCVFLKLMNCAVSPEALLAEPSLSLKGLVINDGKMERI